MSSCESLPYSPVDAILRRERLDRDDLIALLSAEGAAAGDQIRRLAYQTKLTSVGAEVYLRGLVEISNRCAKNCLYCGIRRDRNVSRYSMTRREIMECIRWIGDAKYGSVVLQGGERQDARFARHVESIVGEIRRTFGEEFGITLSFGEQRPTTLERWRDAGADRYLLRIETSNETLFGTLHPEAGGFLSRLRCLADLARLGYQVGSGVMIGLPGQSIADLANDLLFLRDLDVDMIGMGPYLVHRGTPLGAAAPDGTADREGRLALALRMVSLARILLPDINIAATTALQALHPNGRELALLAGANVLMPVVTPSQRRQHYELYEGRPCVTEQASDCRTCVKGRISAIGERVAFGRRGDAPRVARRARESCELL
jgi:biotin synthase